MIKKTTEQIYFVVTKDGIPVSDSRNRDVKRPTRILPDGFLGVVYDAKMLGGSHGVFHVYRNLVPGQYAININDTPALVPTKKSDKNFFYIEDSPYECIDD